MNKKMDESLSMLKEIQELEFMAVDLNLFLDTHPEDQAAHRDFYAVCDKLMALRKRYEEIYGPLTVTGSTPPHRRWPWSEDPWPWEIEYM